MPHFVFLEFLDSRVEQTLRELRDSLQPWKKSASPVHVTVRGPYKTEPDIDLIRELGQNIRGRGVRIMGAGYFEYNGKFSVFLRAESSVFKDIWWKPDFPSRSDEIQPHLTMFESTDRHSALIALNFLRAARISILTYSVQLSIYTTGQGDLFGTRAVEPIPPNSGVKRDIVAIDDEVLPAAKEIGARLALRREKIENSGTDSGKA